MAKGQVQVVVIKTNDDKLMLQMPEVDPINKQVDNNITVYDDVETLLAALKRKLNRTFQ